MTTPQDIQEALDDLYKRAVIRLDQINIQLRALGQAAPEAVSEIRNYLHCSNTARKSHAPEARTVDAELIEAAKAVIERWDTPNWKDAGPTAEVINRLRKSVDELLRRGFRQGGGS